MLQPLSAINNLSSDPVDYFPLLKDPRWDSADLQDREALELELQRCIAWSSFRHSMMIYLPSALSAIFYVQGLLLNWIEPKTVLFMLAGQTLAVISLSLLDDYWTFHTLKLRDRNYREKEAQWLIRQEARPWIWQTFGNHMYMFRLIWAIMGDLWQCTSFSW